MLYTMLCGRAPFHARSRDETVSSIMGRIKEGDFTFNSAAWGGVSGEAKSVVRGLLTVDPAQRLRMTQLEVNSWVQGSQNFVSTPLMTPDILLGTSAEKSLQTTFNAFHKAQREGFRLQDVFSAKLAQRRRMKKSSSDNNSSSSSSFTSEGSLKSRPNLSLEVKKSDDQQTRTKLADTKMFSFGENRVTEFLQTMSANPLDPDTVSPSNSVNARTSESSLKCEDVLRGSTGSSGIVVSDKNSTETNVVVKKRPRKVYVQTRRSERIRRKQRMEIDLDPVFAVIPEVKKSRKRDRNVSTESPSKTKRKKAAVSSTRKTKKGKIHR